MIGGVFVVFRMVLARNARFVSFSLRRGRITGCSSIRFRFWFFCGELRFVIRLMSVRSWFIVGAFVRFVSVWFYF